MNANKGEIVIYKEKNGKATLEVNLKKESVWLRLDQIAILFDRDKSVISRHIKNIFKEKELDNNSVVANFATTATDGKTYQVDYYNLDVIISVGYRVKSQKGVSFRIWAMNILKEHIIKGYTLNQNRLNEIREKQLNEFKKTINLIKGTIETKQLSNMETEGLLHIIADYANSWLLLQKYDENKLDVPSLSNITKYKFDYIEAQSLINEFKHELIAKKEASDLFGQEKDKSFTGIIGNIYQTFDEHELYPSIEEKAAHLLYFIIKDHPFLDGNKRIGSFLFIVFLARNNYLFKKMGEKKINDNALVAIALLIAESSSDQKNIIIKLIMNFLNEEN